MFNRPKYLFKNLFFLMSVENKIGEKKSEIVDYSPDEVLSYVKKSNMCVLNMHEQRSKTSFMSGINGMQMHAAFKEIIF